MNETLNQTIEGTFGKISFNEWTAISTSPEFIVASLIVWGSVLIICLIIGAVVKGKTASGTLLSKPMIGYVNYWYLMLIFLFILPALYLLLIVFPVWLKLWS